MTKKEFFQRLLIFLLTITVVLLIVYSFRIILMIFASCLLAVLFTGLSDLLRRFIPWPENIRLLLVLLAISFCIAAFSYLFGQGITSHIDKFSSSLENAYNSFIHQLKLSTLGTGILEKATNGVDNTTGYRILSKVTDIFSTTLGSLFDIFVIVFLGLFLSFEHRMYTDGLIKLFPARYRDQIDDLLNRTNSVLRWWMLGQFLYMLTIGILSTLGLWFLGMPMALTLGLLAMILSFIPYLGTIFSAVPALLIALTISNQMVLYVVILYGIIHLVTSYLVAPLIQLEAISLPPALTIVGQILLAYLVGGLGLLLATPLIAVIIVLVEVLYVKQVLGDDITLLSKHKRTK